MPFIRTQPDMNDDAQITTPSAHGAPGMSRDIAKLIVELMNTLRVAHDDLDAADVDRRELREQRTVLLQQLHEADREIKRQRERIAVLADANRALLAERREWTRVAA